MRKTVAHDLESYIGTVFANRNKAGGKVSHKKQLRLGRNNICGTFLISTSFRIKNIKIPYFRQVWKLL